jgi:glycosyltransferase involved in cell wall biosynthesis
MLADSRSFHTERCARELVRQGCRVVTASLERGRLCHVRLRKLGPVAALHYPLAVLGIRRLVDKYCPDIINPHFASGYGFAAALAARKRGAPVVLELWGSDILIVPAKSFLHRRKTVMALRRADYIIGDSHYLIAEAERLTPLPRSAVIPWGIEEAYLTLHRSDRRPSSPLKIIVPRAQEEVYNNVFILRALAPLAEAGEVEIAFPAFGRLAQAFAEKSRLLTSRGVQLYPRLPRAEFVRFMAGFDVYLSASHSDSSPVSLIEAMGLGLLPVAARIPGIAEWLTDENGCTYTEDDAAGLRSIIEGIIKGDSLHDAWRRGNLARVRREAVFENNMAQRISIMKNLAG